MTTTDLQPHTDECVRLNLTLLCAHDAQGRPECITDPDGSIALAERAAGLITCTEHLSCRLVGLLPAEVTTAERQQGIGAALRRVVELRGRGEYMGSIRDDGFHVHPNHGGGWRTRWTAFAGGANVHVSDEASRDPDPARALAELREYCDRARFHMRMAMHP